MRTSLVLAVLAIAAAPAAAQPSTVPTYAPYAVLPGPAPEPTPWRDHGYLGGGVGLTFDQFFNGFLNVEGGLRLGSKPLWIRGSAARGSSTDIVEGGGAYSQLRIGLETRACSDGGGACVFFGFDVGTERQTWSKLDEMTEHYQATIAGPRFGLDAGGERVRFRAGIEAYRYYPGDGMDLTVGQASGGIGFSLAVLHRL